jgi:hypothetical protein
MKFHQTMLIEVILIRFDVIFASLVKMNENEGNVTTSKQGKDN